jgi:aspartate 4-decarboxylase
MKRAEEKRYEVLSPFEIKNKLIQMAGSHHERMMLNAGRGNPNWVAAIPRHGFFQLGRFAMEETERTSVRTGFGGAPDRKGIGKRFEGFIAKNLKAPGVSFLRDAVAYVRDEIKIDPDEFVEEMVDGIIADHYPTPDRMLSCSGNADFYTIPGNSALERLQVRGARNKAKRDGGLAVS